MSMPLISIVAFALLVSGTSAMAETLPPAKPAVPDEGQVDRSLKRAADAKAAAAKKPAKKAKAPAVTKTQLDIDLEEAEAQVKARHFEVKTTGTGQLVDYPPSKYEELLAWRDWRNALKKRKNGETLTMEEARLTRPGGPKVSAPAAPSQPAETSAKPAAPTPDEAVQ